MNPLQWSNTFEVANVTGHMCGYQKTINWFFEYNTYCTFNEFNLRWGSYILLVILVYLLIKEIKKKLTKAKANKKGKEDDILRDNYNALQIMHYHLYQYYYIVK